MEIGPARLGRRRFLASLSAGVAGLAAWAAPLFGSDQQPISPRSPRPASPHRPRTYTYKAVGNLEIKADVLRPDDATRRPVLLWIHGGALIRGYRMDINPQIKTSFMNAGYAIVSIDYRLAPETKLPQIIDDLRDAYTWLADQQERQRAAEEAQRAAENRKLAERQRRKERLSVYRDLPPSTRDVVNVLKKLEARTEVGVTYANYSTVVGETWGDVKVFIESPDGKKFSELTVLLMKAVEDYKVALDIWDRKIQYSSIYGHNTDVEIMIQSCWSQAGALISLAASLLDPEKTETVLETVEALPSTLEDKHDAWVKLQAKILKR